MSQELDGASLAKKLGGEVSVASVGERGQWLFR